VNEAFQGDKINCCIKIIKNQRVPAVPQKHDMRSPIRAQRVNLRQHNKSTSTRRQTQLQLGQ